MENIDSLQAFVDSFLTSDDKQQTVIISNTLRKPIRQFKTQYPNLFYFAYGSGKQYTLVLSKDKFNIELNILTNKCKNFFFSYSGLKMNIKMLTELHVSSKLHSYLGLDKWLNLWNDCLLKLGGDKDFISKHYELEKLISTDLKKSQYYADWKNKQVTQQQLKYKPNPVLEPGKYAKSHGIYNPSNDGRYFISIDLKAANFQVLRENKLINCRTWAEYLNQYINDPYFTSLKKLRLKVFSVPELYPAKQKICWENITLDILDNLIDNNIMSETNFAMYQSDEIVFHADKDDKLLCKQFINEHFPNYDISCELFQLRYVNVPTKTRNITAYVKINQENSKITWKCINVEDLAKVIDVWNP